MVAPSNAIVDLGHSDRRPRHRATVALAHFLADRLGCFAISASDLGNQAVPLFPELPNHAVRRNHHATAGCRGATGTCHCARCSIVRSTKSISA